MLQQTYSFFLTLYAPVHTVPPPAPTCCKCIALGGKAEDLKEVIVRSSQGMILDGMAQIPELLPNWKLRTGGPTFGFQDPWWVADIPNYYKGESEFVLAIKLDEAESFFKVCVSIALLSSAHKCKGFMADG